MTEQTGQRGEVETGTSSADDSRAETSQDEADEMAGPNEQSGYEGDSGSSSDGSGSSGSSEDSGSSGSSGSSGGSPEGASGSSDDSGSTDSSSAQDSGSSSSDSGSGSRSSGSGSSTATAQKQDRKQDQQDHGEDGAGPQGRSTRTPLNIGELVWKVCNVLATVVRLVGYALAAVIVAFLVLTFVGVNTANGVAQVIGSIAEFAVLSFRDLFLIADPVFAAVVNYGLAAIFWVLVAEFGSRLVRWAGARLS